MRTLLSLALAILPLSGLAANPETVKAALAAETACANFVAVEDEKLILGFGAYWRFSQGPYHVPVPSPLVVMDLTGRSERKVVQTGAASMDALVWDGKLFVLTYEGLEERALPSLELIALHATHGENRPLLFKEHARGMAIHGERLYFAHGKLGMTVFDLPTRRFVARVPLLQRQLPLISVATDVLVREGAVWVLMDTHSMTRPDQRPAFSGLVVVDAATLEVRRELAGIDPGADALASDGEKLMVSYMGYPVWHFRWAELGGNRLPRHRYTTNFGRPGHPTGRPYVDSTYYHSCFWTAPASPQDTSRPTRVPVSLERATLDI